MSFFPTKAENKKRKKDKLNLEFSYVGKIIKFNQSSTLIRIYIIFLSKQIIIDKISSIFIFFFIFILKKKKKNQYLQLAVIRKENSEI